MKAATFAGAVLILVGLLFFLNVISLATLIVDTTPPKWEGSISFIYGSFDNPVEPYSTALSESSSSPGLLAVGREGDIFAAVTEDNPGSATVNIDGTTYTMTLHSSAGSLRRYIYHWTTPSSMDKLVTFIVTVKDAAGNTVSKTVYGKTGSFDGYFEVNGQKITSTTQVVYLNSRTLNIKFVATSGGAWVYAVHVILKDLATNQYVSGFDSSGNPVYMTESTADQVWTQTVTLPSDGRFEATGTVYLSSTVSYTKMQITFDTGVEIIPFTFGVNQILGLVSMAAGAVLIIRKKPA